MKLVLAMDLRRNLVVHGQSGARSEYKPLVWGASPTADPKEFVKAISPKYIYIADLDRIEGKGSHDAIVHACSSLVDCCYIDRGCRAPADMLQGKNIRNIVGTETSGDSFDQYHGAFLSADIRDGKVIPSGSDPASFLRMANSWDFEGCILLNISAVGTEQGLGGCTLSGMREAYEGMLFQGGGVATGEDLDILAAEGFDGAIIATALHKGTIPIEAIRRGIWS
jgi:phosphoribosylformimino-5-aminoimidazole carboxamide ribotide isomerase